MRSDSEIEGGITAVENRIDRDSENMEDDALGPVVMSIHQAKRAALHTVRDSPNGEHWEMYDQLKGSLTMDMPVVEYTQAQAMINAHEWAQGNLDSL